MMNPETLLAELEAVRREAAGERARAEGYRKEVLAARPAPLTEAEAGQRRLLATDLQSIAAWHEQQASAGAVLWSWHTSAASKCYVAADVFIRGEAPPEVREWQHPDAGRRCRWCGRGVYNCADPCACDGPPTPSETAEGVAGAPGQIGPRGAAEDDEPLSTEEHAILRSPPPEVSPPDRRDFERRVKAGLAAGVAMQMRHMRIAPSPTPREDWADAEGVTHAKLCSGEVRGGRCYCGAVKPWTPTSGARVRTDRLKDKPHCARPCGSEKRRANVAGVVDFEIDPRDGGGWQVRHDDGTEAPYDADELRPEPEPAP